MKLTAAAILVSRGLKPVLVAAAAYPPRSATRGNSRHDLGRRTTLHRAGAAGLHRAGPRRTDPKDGRRLPQGKAQRVGLARFPRVRLRSTKHQPRLSAAEWRGDELALCALCRPPSLR